MSVPHASPGSPERSASPATAARVPSASPGPDAARAVRDWPWRSTCPDALRPWVQPQHPCPDPWTLAQQAGILVQDPDLLRWSKDPEMRGQSEPLRQAREALQQHAERRLGWAWAVRSRDLRALPGPSLPQAVERLLPPPAGQILIEAWQECLQDLLRAAWEQPQDPTQDWRLQALVPPFPDPPPAEIPDPPVAPGPTVWLAWASPEPGRVEPLLVRAERAPMGGECLELRHEGSGLLVVPTMVGAALSLEMPATTPIIRAMSHHSGSWEDVTPPS